MFDFEKLNVYLKAEKVYIVLNKNVFNLKFDINLKNQLKRASSSILLNISEGSWKIYKKEKNYFYTVSRWSTFECVSILRILRIEWIINDEIYLEIYWLLEEVWKMLYWLIYSKDNRIASQ